MQEEAPPTLEHQTPLEEGGELLHLRGVNLSGTPCESQRGLSLVEVLIVVAIMGVIASLVIAAFGNASQDTRRVIARQQQAAVQSALNAWITSASAMSSVSAVRSNYNAAASSSNRLALLTGYLDADTHAHFNTFTTNSNQVRSDAMRNIGSYLELAAWPSDGYPKVNLLP